MPSSARGAVALLLVAYDYVYDQVVTPTPGDADIGKGLLAFLLVAGLCFMWSLLDGLRLSPLVLGGRVGRRRLGGGPRLGARDRRWVVADVEVGGIVFTAQLVIVPAIFGAGLAWALGGRSRDAQPVH